MFWRCHQVLTKLWALVKNWTYILTVEDGTCDWTTLPTANTEKDLLHAISMYFPSIDWLPRPYILPDPLVSPLPASLCNLLLDTTLFGFFIFQSFWSPLRLSVNPFTPIPVMLVLKSLLQISLRLSEQKPHSHSFMHVIVKVCILLLLNMYMCCSPISVCLCVLLYTCKEDSWQLLDNTWQILFNKHSFLYINFYWNILINLFLTLLLNQNII